VSLFITDYVCCIIKYMARPRRPEASPLPADTARARGITSADVDRAADALLRDGQRPTIEKVRARIGRGSPNTINPLLDAWWSRLAGRLDAGPAALHRLPEAVAQAAEGLWMQALNEARRRTTAETGSSRKALARDRQELEIQGHILAVREAELRARIEAAERRSAQLELEVQTLTTMLRKEQASRLAAERGLTERPSSPGIGQRRPGRGRAPKPTVAARKRQPAKSRKPARKTSRTRAPNQRNLSVKSRGRR
jgi:hypothetical protein